MHRFLRSIAAASLMVLGMSAAFATKTASGEYNSLYAGLGAKGYDVVAYFTDGKPSKGSADFTAEYGGVTWQFKSAANRDRFKANPAKYAPQYGGYCAWGVAQGKLFDVDPVSGWRIVDGKLYMSFNADILKTWSDDVKGNIVKADSKWPSLNE